MTAASRVAGAVAALASAMLLAWGSRAPMRFHATTDGVVRLAWSARPERVERCVTHSDEELQAVPAHMRQRVTCEGRSARYRLVVRRDGEVLADEMVHGGGVRQDRSIYLLRDFPTRPGRHRLEVMFERLDSVEAAPADVALARRRDEAVPSRLTLDATHDLGARSVLLITFDAEQRALVARASADRP